MCYLKKKLKFSEDMQKCLKKTFGWRVSLHESVVLQLPDLWINKTVVGFMSIGALSVLHYSMELSPQFCC